MRLRKEATPSISWPSQCPSLTCLKQPQLCSMQLSNPTPESLRERTWGSSLVSGRCFLARLGNLLIRCNRLLCRKPTLDQPFILIHIDSARWQRERGAGSTDNYHQAQKQVFTNCEKFIWNASQDKTEDLHIEAILSKSYEAHSHNIMVDVGMFMKHCADIGEHCLKLLRRSLALQFESGSKGAFVVTAQIFDIHCGQLSIGD